MRVELGATEEEAVEACGLGAARFSGPPVEQEQAIAMLDLLAHWWSQPVADELAVWLGARDVVEELAAQAPGPVGSLLEKVAGPDEMLLAYEELLIGPGPVPCPPYESYWRNDVGIDIRRTLMGPCIVELNRLYGEMGLEVKPNSGELPDHLALEFEALAYSLSRSDGERIAHELFFEHLKKWLPRFCSTVIRESRQPFYVDLARLTRDWLEALSPFFDSIAQNELTAG